MNPKIIVPILIITVILGIFFGNHFLNKGLELSVADISNDTTTLSLKIKQLELQVASLEKEVKSLKEQAPVVAKGDPSQQQEAINNNQSADQAEKQVKTAYVLKKHDFVNVRQGPGTNYGVVSKVYQNSPMIILGEENDWYRVKLEDGKIGWAASWVLEVK